MERMKREEEVCWYRKERAEKTEGSRWRSRRGAGGERRGVVPSDPVSPSRRVQSTEGCSCCEAEELEGREERISAHQGLLSKREGRENAEKKEVSAQHAARGTSKISSFRLDTQMTSEREQRSYLLLAGTVQVSSWSSTRPSETRTARARPFALVLSSTRAGRER